MSAIATPMVHTTNTIGGESDMVNVENCSTITKSVNKPVVGSVNQAPYYGICFHIDENGAGTPNFVVWKYAEEADRDTDFAALLAFASTAL